MGEMLGKLVGRLVLIAILGLSLVLWAWLLGGGSLVTGFVGIGLSIVVFGVLDSLRNKPAWAKSAKGLVLVGLVVWTISDMLPITTTWQWVASILFAGIVGVIGYTLLFEEFFK